MSKDYDQAGAVGDRANPILGSRTAERQAAHLLDLLKPDMIILDIGCGPGTITLGLAPFVPQGRIIGLDLNEKSIDIARASATKAGLTNIEFQTSNANDLSAYASDSIDVIHSHQLFAYLPDPIAVLKEWRRALKPGGLISLRDATFITAVPALPHLEDYFEKLALVLGRRGGTHTPGRNHVHWLCEAGFKHADLTLTSAAWEYSGQEGRATWTAGARDGLRAPLAQLGIMTDEQYEHIAQAWDEWTGLEEGRLMALDSAIIARK